jgi:hypothetical protein
MLHQWIEFEQGIWAGLDNRKIPEHESRQFLTGYAAGRAILDEMKRRGQYVPNPEETRELKAKLGICRGQVTRERKRCQQLQKTLDKALLELSAAGRRLGRSVDADSIRGEVRP